jgi:cytoskeletal protein CcmA (bactofilin family)
LKTLTSLPDDRSLLQETSMFRRKTDQPSIDVSRLSSLIAAGVQIAGDVIVTDGVRIDGQVTGNVIAKPETKGLLVLSEKGRIEGNVHVHDAVVNGTICGDLEVENFIELQAGARVTGAIRYRTLQMTCGARVEGTMVCTADVRTAAPDNVVSLSKAAEG